MKLLENIRNAAATGVIALTIALSVAPASAQEVSPDHLKLARQYVDITDRVQIYEATVVTTSLQVLQVLTQQNPEIADEIAVAIEETLSDYRGRKDELMNQIARVYAQRFTIDELKQIVDFYSSEVGTKLAEQNFEANQQVQAIMSIFRGNLNTEFLAQVRAELKEDGYDV